MCRHGDKRQGTPSPPNRRRPSPEPLEQQPHRDKPFQKKVIDLLNYKKGQCPKDTNCDYWHVPSCIFQKKKIKAKQATRVRSFISVKMVDRPVLKENHKDKVKHFKAIAKQTKVGRILFAGTNAGSRQCSCLSGILSAKGTNQEEENSLV